MRVNELGEKTSVIEMLSGYNHGDFSTGSPLCIPGNCWFKSNETDCVSADFPTQV